MTMGHPEHLLLDSSIRDWVVFPMLLMLLLVGMGRHYVQTVIKSVPTFTKSDIAEQQYKNVCMQCSYLRMNGNFLTEAAFSARRANMIGKKTGQHVLLSVATLVLLDDRKDPFIAKSLYNLSLIFSKRILQAY